MNPQDKHNTFRPDRAYIADSLNPWASRFGGGRIVELQVSGLAFQGLGFSICSVRRPCDIV